jgi:hypothetical protein
MNPDVRLAFRAHLLTGNSSLVILACASPILHSVTRLKVLQLTQSCAAAPLPVVAIPEASFRDLFLQIFNKFYNSLINLNEDRAF